MTSIELKEQIKLLRAEQNKIRKETNKKIDDYHKWCDMRKKNKCFPFIYFCSEIRYDSFWDMIYEEELSNNKFSKTDWEIVFKLLGYKDIEFFTAFINWEKEIFELELEDRKCNICFEWYNNTNKKITKWGKCSHINCRECYDKIVNKTCPLCRTIEK